MSFHHVPKKLYLVVVMGWNTNPFEYFLKFADKWLKGEIPAIDNHYFVSNQYCVALTQKFENQRCFIFLQTAQGDVETCCNRESEVVGLLLHIVSECIIVVEQIQQTLKLRQDQLQAKQLRSRQRDNFTKLLKR